MPHVVTAFHAFCRTVTPVPEIAYAVNIAVRRGHPRLKHDDDPSSLQAMHDLRDHWTHTRFLASPMYIWLVYGRRDVCRSDFSF